MDRRTRTQQPPDGVDRRRGDRRAAQAAVLDHRRAGDRRLDAEAQSVVLQQQAFARLARPTPGSAPARRVVDLVDRVVALPEARPAPAPPVVRDACPLCGVRVDRPWLFRHVAGH